MISIGLGMGIITVVTYALFITVVAYALWIIFKPQTWLRAYNSGAKVKFTELIALQIFNVPPDLIIDARIELFKSGIDISAAELRRHYISGGDVNMVVEGLLRAQKKMINLSFAEACELDLQEKKVLYGDPMKKRIREGGQPKLNGKQNPLVVAFLILGFAGCLIWWVIKFESS